MRAGNLDRRVTILRLVYTTNAFNEQVHTWEDGPTVWAQQRPNRGAERFTAAEIAGSAVTTFHIRWRGDVTVRDRLRYDGREYEIMDVRELGRRVVLEIDATARTERPQ